MTTTAPCLQIRNLQCLYAGPIDLDVARGECVALSGPSGAGKSVILRMIADLDPNSGQVSLAGRARDTFAAPDWRRHVIYQAAEPAWWEATADAHFTDEQKPLVLALLPRLGLAPESLAAPIDRLSTGERQRLALIRSLAYRPEVLLLDEPTSALDALSVTAVETLLREQLTQGLALVLVTHAAEQAQRLAQRIVRLEKRAQAA